MGKKDINKYKRFSGAAVTLALQQYELLGCWNKVAALDAYKRFNLTGQQMCEKVYASKTTKKQTGVKITIALDTPYEKIESLKDYLVHYLENEESREFFSDLSYKINDFVSKQALVLNFWITHKSNWQDVGRKNARRNRFMCKLREGLIALGIELTDFRMELQERL
ncbi:hypothetical protein HK099_001840 [Clydaea vesicula]|uniref:Uncharacterized protein n=1 Tax=Clydaea vesicula TaxID=447962 RepID=A0AAD5XX16_9FUNG|nr:hypothetical protein HK099_001840 [Clydaea vesicula]